MVADDAVELATAAGCVDRLELVCPQRFAAPLAPPLAAACEGKAIDANRLRRGAEAWSQLCEVLIVEGAGGLMSPLAADEFVADLAYDLGFPVIVVVRNSLGAINQALQTLITAATFRDGLDVAGIVLNHTAPPVGDESLRTNRREIERLAVPPVLAELVWQAEKFDAEVDWFALARQPATRTLDEAAEA